jgi:hypothetical protein
MLLVVTGNSCDTTQPMQAETQLVELYVDAGGLPNGSNTRFFNVYDGMADCNGDGEPDDDDMDGQPDVFLHCLTRTNRPSGGPNGLPWNYTVEVSIVRNDATGPERITSEQAMANPTFSLTPSDTRTNFSASPPPDLAPINLAGCRFTFSNKRIRTAINQTVLAATYNPLAIINPSQYGTEGTGLCSTHDPGPPVVDRLTGTDYPYVIALGKGETLTVKIVNAVTAPDGVTPGVDFPAPGPSVNARLFLNGKNLNIQNASAAPGGDFSVTYTSR